MTRISEALQVLKSLGLPTGQHNDRSALTLLALAGLGPDDEWKQAARRRLRTVDIMAFIKDRYQKTYAPNSRETFRRQTLHQFVQARLVDRNPDDPSRPTNSGNTCYELTAEAIAVLRTIGKRTHQKAVATFLVEQGSLAETYLKRRDANVIPLTLPDGTQVSLSPGKHNALQVAIIEQMGPRFTPGASVLYVGDTAAKHVVYHPEALAQLAVPITTHDKLPDVVLYHAENNWLILAEAVTSHGPVSPKRYIELEEMLASCTADRVYVTAFPTRAEFRRYAADIAWETEVWISESPGHMIHFNGPKFLGPYKSQSGEG